MRRVTDVHHLTRQEARRIVLRATMLDADRPTDLMTVVERLTALPVGRKTVEEVAQKGGRYRWKVENEGFNRQKNSGLNLEHVYSIDPEKWKAYYLLLQIAFLLLQLLERGSLLRRLAAEVGRPVWTIRSMALSK